MAYRDEAGKAAREARWTILRFVPLVVGIVLAVSLLGFGLNSMGMFGKTVVERKVFEQSYQRSEAIKSQIATSVATLAEIDRQLANPALDESTRFNLNAQAAAARVRISIARSKQN